MRNTALHRILILDVADGSGSVFHFVRHVGAALRRLANRPLGRRRDSDLCPKFGTGLGKKFSEYEVRAFARRTVDYLDRKTRQTEVWIKFCNLWRIPHLHFAEVDPGQHFSRKAKLAVDVGKIVEGNNSDEQEGRSDQIALGGLLLRKLSFSGAKIAGVVRNLFDALTGADREVAHLKVGVALAELRRPSIVKRRGKPTARSH